MPLLALYEKFLVVANETEFRVIDVENPNEVMLQKEVTAIKSLQLTALQGELVALYIAENSLHGVDMNGEEVVNASW